MKSASLACLLCALAAPIASGAETLTTFKFDAGALSSNMTPQPVGCSFPLHKLPNKFVIFATGAQAGKEIDFQIDQSGHQATKVDVALNYPDAPVVLMVGAYEPTIWNIGWTAKTRIAAVFASGYHRQALAGLQEATPFFISTYENKAGCGSSYVTPENPSAFDALARKLFNRPVETIYPVSNGVVLMGSPIKANTRFLTSDSKTVESYHDKNAPLAGPAGIRDAVKKGLLRLAVQDDMQAWIDATASQSEQESSAAKSTKSEQAATMPIAADKPARKFQVPSNSYVVLKPFVFPAGLFGGHSAAFFVPKGIERPTGNPGHSSVFDFNSLTCTGHMCGAYAQHPFRGQPALSASPVIGSSPAKSRSD